MTVRVIPPPAGLPPSTRSLPTHETARPRVPRALALPRTPCVAAHPWVAAQRDRQSRRNARRMVGGDGRDRGDGPAAGDRRRETGGRPAEGDRREADRPETDRRRSDLVHVELFCSSTHGDISTTHKSDDVRNHPVIHASSANTSSTKCGTLYTRTLVTRAPSVLTHLRYTPRPRRRVPSVAAHPRSFSLQSKQARWTRSLRALSRRCSTSTRRWKMSRPLCQCC